MKHVNDTRHIYDNVPTRTQNIIHNSVVGIRQIRVRIRSTVSVTTIYNPIDRNHFDIHFTEYMNV